ncbi:hypothetical protein ACKWTF_003284 [Chironomus riparius]
MSSKMSNEDRKEEGSNKMTMAGSNKGSEVQVAAIDSTEAIVMSSEMSNEDRKEEVGNKVTMARSNEASEVQSAAAVATQEAEISKEEVDDVAEEGGEEIAMVQSATTESTEEADMSKEVVVEVEEAIEKPSESTDPTNDGDNYEPKFKKHPQDYLTPGSTMPTMSEDLPYDPTVEVCNFR